TFRYLHGSLQPGGVVLGQQLAAMRFQSSTLLQKLAGRKKVSVTEVERLDHLLAETLQQVRNLSRGLHPVSLDSHGLMHGLRELARQCLALLGVPCAFECVAPVLVLDQRAALNLYRIAQEAVRNAAVHGAPQHIRVGLAEAAGHLRLTITDDGRGLPPDITTSSGLGLEIMRYRAASIGATCDIQSQPGAGVTILCGWHTTI
ncbi:MAG: ATP-binding protein, partial [Verrucomicrobiota bacterium]